MQARGGAWIKRLWCPLLTFALFDPVGLPAQELGRPPFEITCAILPDGLTCPDKPDLPADCLRPVCRQGRCVDEPVDRREICRDTDGNPFTIPLCVPGTGECDQAGLVRTQYIDPDVAAVFAEPTPVVQREAFNDCCIFCAHQSLESLIRGAVPTRRERPELGPPDRIQACGRAHSYGVNNELDDPQDILLNIVPSERFRDLVVGFGRFACEDVACLHTEIDPPDQFWLEDRIFLPISQPTAFDTSPFPCGKGGVASDCTSRLEELGEEVCVYGVFAIDHGGHRISEHPFLAAVRDDTHDHPEIHPFDAVWWLHPSRNGWMAAIFQDASNRYSAPHCGSENNFNLWSQPPRDVTLRFPFSFPREEAPVRACLRHVRTENFAGERRPVIPLNVTTAAIVDPEPEIKALRVGFGPPLFEVVEEPGFEDEWLVRIERRPSAPDVVEGVIEVRAAVGCNEVRGTDQPLMDCELADLRQLNPGGRHDADNPGWGFLYYELLIGPEHCGRPRPFPDEGELPAPGGR